MANRTGQQHSIAKINRQISVSAVAPRVQYASNSADSGAEARASYTIGSILRQINTRLEDRLDVRAQIEGRAAGAKAGTQDGLPQLESDETIRGRAYNVAAKDTAITRLDMQAREALVRVENENENNPSAYKKKADSYLKGQLGQLQAFDPQLAQRFEADFTARIDAGESRVKDRHDVIVRDRQLELALRHQLGVQEDMAQDAQALFSGDAVQTQATMARMIGNAAKLVDTSNQIGPDGRPLFDARSRIAAERDAENMVSEQIGLAWMKKQPDMLTAFKDWQSGNAEIVLAGEDGKAQRLNLRDVLGAQGYEAAGKSFMENMRSELAIENQINAAQDREFDKRSDAIYADLTVKAQEGQLTLSAVEDMRRNLDPDKYLSLRTIAKNGGASVTDGAIFSDLAIRDANGEDIRPLLRNSSSKLTREDYLTLYQRNTDRIGVGTKNAVDTGRTYLTQSLGVLSKELGIGQSAAIGQANAEYEIEVKKFVVKEERQPTLVEARDIAEQVRSRYSVLSVEDSLLSMPLPQSMTQAEKLNKNLNSAAIQQKVEKINQLFLQKYNGDVDQRNADPAYRQEMRLLKDYYDVLQLKENKNGQ